MNQYNQVTHLTQDTIWESDKNIAIWQHQIQITKKLSSKKNLGLRSGSTVFFYDSKCLFCCKTIQVRMLKAESQMPEKHLAYKVRSHFAQQQLKAKCLERKDI